jgi:DNA-binding CsgD family transcriptional regulator
MQPSGRVVKLRARRSHPRSPANPYGYRPYPRRGRDHPRRGLLTPREQEVRAAAASHHTAADIAAQLHPYEGTVRIYLSAAIRKVGARNRREAIELANEKGPALEGNGRALLTALAHDSVARLASSRSLRWRSRAEGRVP